MGMRSLMSGGASVPSPVPRPVAAVNQIRVASYLTTCSVRRRYLTTCNSWRRYLTDLQVRLARYSTTCSFGRRYSTPCSFGRRYLTTCSFGRLDWVGVGLPLLGAAGGPSVGSGSASPSGKIMPWPVSRA